MSNNTGLFILGAGALALFALSKNADATPSDDTAQSTQLAAADTSFFTSAPATTATNDYLNRVDFTAATQKLIDERLKSGEMQAAYYSQLQDMKAQTAREATEQKAAASNMTTITTASNSTPIQIATDKIYSVSGTPTVRAVDYAVAKETQGMTFNPRSGAYSKPI